MRVGLEYAPSIKIDLTLEITIVSDWENEGGANIAAVRVTEALAGSGHSIHRVYQKAGSDSSWDTALIPSKLNFEGMPRLEQLKLKLMPINIRTDHHRKFSEDRLRLILEKTKPQVINLHNLHIAGWSPELIRICSETAPTLCTLHDTWSFTGRCYNPGTCTKFLTQCDESCPTPHEYPQLSPSKIRSAFEQRSEILNRNQNIAAAVPSDWLGGLAISGLWKNREVFKIPYPIDLDCYRPMDRKSAQELLGLSSTKTYLLSCAADLRNTKKGLHLLVDALRGNKDFHLLLLGAPLPPSELHDLEVTQFGYVLNDKLKAIIYNAADFYVHPSLADNAPLTVIEALSCGTPVIAFPIDGLPELVITGRTGRLAAGVSSEELKLALLESLASKSDSENLRESCRAFAIDTFGPGDVAEKYRRVFDHMLVKNGGASDLLVRAKA